MNKEVEGLMLKQDHL